MSPGSVVLQMVTVRGGGGLRREVTGRGLWFAEEVRACPLRIGAHPLQRGPRPGGASPCSFYRVEPMDVDLTPSPRRVSPPTPVLPSSWTRGTWRLSALGNVTIRVTT